MTSQLPIFPRFDVHNEPQTVGQRWLRWVKRYETYAEAFSLTKDSQKRALLLYWAGEDVQNIYDTISSAQASTGASSSGSTTVTPTYDETVNSLTAYFNPPKSTHFEVFKFHDAKQLFEESIDSYHVRLRSLANTCGFTDVDKEIMGHIIRTCTSQVLRSKALQKMNLSLQELLLMARTMEVTEAQALEIESKVLPSSECRTVNHMHNKKQNNFAPATKKQGYRNTNSKTCFNCGRDYPHKSGISCPAKGKQCNTCGKLNHFSAVCRRKTNWSTKTSNKEYSRTMPRGQVLSLDSGGGHQTDKYVHDAEDRVVFNVNERNIHNIPTVDLWIGSSKVKFILDTGASCNLLDAETFKNLKYKPKVYNTSTKIFTYGSDEPLPLNGMFKDDITLNEVTVNETFFVTNVRRAPGPILGYSAMQKLGLIQKINQMKQEMVNITEKYENVFNGMGKLKGVSVKLHINENVKPVAQPHRRIPFHLRQKVEEEIKVLQSEDIIEPVEGPTPWISPIVIAKKASDPNRVRICIDMRMANTAIERERHPTPTIDDLIQEIQGATVFSKLDLRRAYHQLELDEESRYITTFSTHQGLWRYKRLSFGITSASEVFQNQLERVLHDIKGARNISDDILVFGKGEEDHDRKLEKTLARIKEVGLKLEKSKCEFKKHELRFFGLVFNSSGVSIDPAKIQAVVAMGPPTNVKEAQSFIGMMTYCSRFVPHYSDVIEPIRRLLKKNCEWHWNRDQQEAFEKCKTMLQEEKVLAYFDTKKETFLTVDASNTGLGAILAQGNSHTDKQMKVVAYASRALTETEKRYSSIEKETMAVKWACEKFRIYLLGKSFTIYSDHNPLEVLLNNPRAKTSARIERFILNLQEFDFKVIYIKGIQNSSDYLSRHPILEPLETNLHSEQVEEVVNQMMQYHLPIAIKLCEIREETNKDVTLEKIKVCLKANSWIENSNDSNVDWNTFKVLKQLKHEITEKDGVLLRGDRIIIPINLRQRMVDLAHESHLGIVKTKKAIRDKVWFPNLDKMVEETVRECRVCQALMPDDKPEPYKYCEIPAAPWEEISIDFLGPLPSGEYLLVVIDDFSRYPVVEIIRSTNSEATIEALENVFSLFGIPKVVRSDNGPPFQGHYFAEYAIEMGFTHKKVTPLWPRGNGLVERVMQPLEKALRTATITKEPWKRTLRIYLRNYRSCPHESTRKTPSELLFGRKIGSKFPKMDTGNTDKYKEIQEIHRKVKQNMIKNTNKQCRKNPRNLQPGDMVLVRNEKRNKIQPHYDPTPYCVSNVKGTMITAERGNKRIVRNCSFFKKLAIQTKGQNNSNTRCVQHGEIIDTDEDEVPDTQQNLVELPDNKLEENSNGKVNSYNLRKKIDIAEDEVTDTSQRKVNSYNLRKNVKPPRFLIDEM